jgi:large subunit ribosomal protein L23
MDPFKVLLYPLVTEKTVGMIEKENKIVFIVSRNADKHQIKDAFEKLFGVKVDKVNTLITRDGKKKAFIKLKKEFKATDVAVKLGIL